MKESTIHFRINVAQKQAVMDKCSTECSTISNVAQVLFDNWLNCSTNVARNVAQPTKVQEVIKNVAQNVAQNTLLTIDDIDNNIYDEFTKINKSKGYSDKDVIVILIKNYVKKQSDGKK